MCRSELELIQFVCELNGFYDTSVPSAGNLIWFGLAMQPKDIELVQHKRRPYFNRYPGLETLARKKLFCSVVNRIRRTFPDRVSFCPRSFQLPEEAEELETYMKEHPKFTFIAKPSRGKGGEGITLIQRYQDLVNTWSFRQADLLVQRYIKKPLLIDK